MPLIRQEEIYPVAGTPWAQAVQMVAGTGGVSRYDVVIVNDIANASSVVPKAVKADADGTNLHAGIMMVATGAAAAGETFLAVPSIVITNVNSAAAAGSPVYLSTTAGAFTITKPAGVDDAVIVVGTVLVNSATVGAVMLNPGGSTLSGLVKTGTVSIASGDSAVTVALGANFGSGNAVATLKSISGGTAITHIKTAAIAGDGTLTITPNAAPGGSFTAVASFVAYSSRL